MSDDRGSFGPSVSCAGDVNGDGLDDLILGAYTADPNGKLDAGKSYVVFGKANGSDHLRWRLTCQQDRLPSRH
jgi:hypothetical protein